MLRKEFETAKDKNDKKYATMRLAARKWMTMYRVRASSAVAGLGLGFVRQALCLGAYPNSVCSDRNECGVGYSFATLTVCPCRNKIRR